MGSLPESLAAAPFRFSEATPLAETLAIPSRVQSPFENTSKSSLRPAFDAPARIVIEAAVLVRIPQVPSHVSDCEMVLVVVADWRMRHAKSVNPEAPDALKAAIAKQICEPRASPPTDHSVTFGPTL